MSHRFLNGALASIVALAMPVALDGQQTVFRSAVDLVRVDVQVVAGSGHPMLELGLDDFEVHIDGDPRRVVSAELVKFSPEDDIKSTLRPVRTPGFIAPDSRVYVIAVDQAGFPPGEIRPLTAALRRFLSQLRPQDLVAVYAFPFRIPSLDLTHDHASAARALDRLIGLRSDYLGVFGLSPSEIVDITASDQDTFQRVVNRECAAVDPTCPEAVQMEATAMAGYLEAESTERLEGFSSLIRSLAIIQGRKTVVLLSGGLISSTRTTGRPDVTSLMGRVGAEIANAQTSLYVLHWATTYRDTFAASSARSLRPADRSESAFEDRDAMERGLEYVAGKAGGALFRVEAGTGDYVFDRVLRETTAYYLLGVEPLQDDRDGRTHFIRVGVKRPGAMVRSRTLVVIPKSR
jgi:VWFA-related protein